ncbi:LLM class flavin-dependent oxidoreductase [Gordonia sp. DT30]|uniref:LLM class flavin-dependent oxidoreductase n=1 Tax=unclassified Gordonia (in: high G+C Gram-positive bacteria) TaxID=2657482 RepID=UPI003CEA5EAA
MAPQPVCDPVIDARSMVLRIADVTGVSGALALARDADRHGTASLVVDPQPGAGVDPFVVAAAIAVATAFTRIGVVVGLDTWRPYPLARRLAQLDQLSAGRIAWSPADPDPRRRIEAIGVVTSLLTSRAPDSVPAGPQGAVPVFVGADRPDRCRVEDLW